MYLQIQLIKLLWWWWRVHFLVLVTCLRSQCPGPDRCWRRLWWWSSVDNVWWGRGRRRWGRGRAWGRGTLYFIYTLWTYLSIITFSPYTYYRVIFKNFIHVLIHDYTFSPYIHMYKQVSMIEFQKVYNKNYRHNVISSPCLDILWLLD